MVKRLFDVEFGTGGEGDLIVFEEFLQKPYYHFVIGCVEYLTIGSFEIIGVCDHHRLSEAEVGSVFWDEKSIDFVPIHLFARHHTYIATYQQFGKLSFVKIINARPISDS